MTLYKREDSPYFQYSFKTAGRRFRGSTRQVNRERARRIEQQVRAGLDISFRRNAHFQSSELKKMIQIVDAAVEPQPMNLGKLYRKARAGAKKRSIEFELTMADLADLWKRAKGACEVSGMPFDQMPSNGTGRRPWTASVDRIDSHKGYTKANCRLVSVITNGAMAEWGERELLLLSRAIGRRQGWW